MITSKATYRQKWQRWRGRREEKRVVKAARKEALGKLEEEIFLPRSERHIKAIKDAFGEYMTALHPVDKGRIVA